MSKLILRKCIYGADTDNSFFKTSAIKFEEGWVIVGFVGELNDYYRIPAGYQNLKIVGIVGDAYKSMKDYKFASLEEIYTPSITFEEESMLFIFPADRQVGKLPKIYPTFNSYKRGAVQKMSSYNGVFMCYDEKLDSNKIAVSMSGATRDYNYTSVGRINLDYKVYFKDEYLGTEKSLLPLWLNASSEHFDKLKLGKYVYDKHSKIPFEDVKKHFDNYKCVFGWVRHNYSDNPCSYLSIAFNTIQGTDVVIDAKS